MTILDISDNPGYYQVEERPPADPVCRDLDALLRPSMVKVLKDVKLIGETPGIPASVSPNLTCTMAYVPRLIQRNIGAILEDLLAEGGLSRADVALWTIHPGGRAILDRAAATLGLQPGELWASYQVLRDYGNMSSATLLFVLELLLAGRGQGRTFAAAFGPGLTVESALLEKLP